MPATPKSGDRIELPGGYIEFVFAGNTERWAAFVTDDSGRASRLGSFLSEDDARSAVASHEGNAGFHAVTAPPVRWSQGGALDRETGLRRATDTPE